MNKLQRFFQGTLIVQTMTKEIYDAFMEVCEAKGYRWRGGRLPTETYNYARYASNTALRCEPGNKIIVHSSADTYRKAHRIVEHLSMNDVKEIRHTYYIRGNA